MGTTKCPERLYEYKRRSGQKTIERLKSSTGIVVEGHLLRLFQEQGFELNPERDNKSVYDPDTLFTALERYAKPTLHVDETAFRRSVDMAYRAFGLRDDQEQLAPVTTPDRLITTIKGEKASGAPYFTSKGEAFGRDYLRSVAIARDGANVPPCVAYHRVQHGEEGPKTRLVWGYPLSMTLVEARYARPLIDRFLGMRSPMAFGLAKHQIATRLMELQSTGVTYGLDFSKFDSSASERIIRIAFAILSTHFDEEALSSEGWNTIINYFIHTTIIMPDGYVWRKHTGVPSGSYFTQLVDSIINYIIVQYCCIRIMGYGLPERKVNVLGDDSILSIGEWIGTEDFADHSAELGFTVNSDKSGRWRHNEAPHFLGHVWESGIPNRPPEEIAKRIAFPETPSKRSTSLEEHRQRKTERLISYIGDASCAWEMVRGTGLLGRTQNLLQLYSFHKRSRYPVTGMEEYQRILGMEVLAAHKTILVGPLR